MTSCGISSNLQRVVKPTFALTGVHVAIEQIIFDDLVFIGCQVVDLIMVPLFHHLYSIPCRIFHKLMPRRKDHLGGVGALCPIVDPRSIPRRRMRCAVLPRAVVKRLAGRNSVPEMSHRTIVTAVGAQAVAVS